MNYFTHFPFNNKISASAFQFIFIFFFRTTPRSTFHRILSYPEGHPSRSHPAGYIRQQTLFTEPPELDQTTRYRFGDRLPKRPPNRVNTRTTTPNYDASIPYIHHPWNNLQPWTPSPNVEEYPSEGPKKLLNPRVWEFPSEDSLERRHRQGSKKSKSRTTTVIPAVTERVVTEKPKFNSKDLPLNIWEFTSEEVSTEGKVVHTNREGEKRLTFNHNSWAELLPYMTTNKPKEEKHQNDPTNPTLKLNLNLSEFGTEKTVYPDIIQVEIRPVDDYPKQKPAEEPNFPDRNENSDKRFVKPLPDTQVLELIDITPRKPEAASILKFPSTPNTSFDLSVEPLPKKNKTEAFLFDVKSLETTTNAPTGPTMFPSKPPNSPFLSSLIPKEGESKPFLTDIGDPFDIPINPDVLNQNRFAPTKDTLYVSGYEGDGRKTKVIPEPLPTNAPNVQIVPVLKDKNGFKTGFPIVKVNPPVIIIHHIDDNLTIKQEDEGKNEGNLLLLNQNQEKGNKPIDSSNQSPVIVINHDFDINVNATEQQPDFIQKVLYILKKTTEKMENYPAFDYDNVPSSLPIIEDKEKVNALKKVLQIPNVYPEKGGAQQNKKKLYQIDNDVPSLNPTVPVSTEDIFNVLPKETPKSNSGQESVNESSTPSLPEQVLTTLPPEIESLDEFTNKLGVDTEIANILRLAVINNSVIIPPDLNGTPEEIKLIKDEIKHSILSGLAKYYQNQRKREDTNGNQEEKRYKRDTLVTFKEVDDSNADNPYSALHLYEPTRTREEWDTLALEINDSIRKLEAFHSQMGQERSNEYDELTAEAATKIDVPCKKSDSLNKCINGLILQRSGRDDPSFKKISARNLPSAEDVPCEHSDGLDLRFKSKCEPKEEFSFITQRKKKEEDLLEGINDGIFDPSTLLLPGEDVADYPPDILKEIHDSIGGAIRRGLVNYYQMKLKEDKNTEVDPIFQTDLRFKNRPPS